MNSLATCQLTTVAFAVLIVLSGGCGGGSSPTPPPPPATKFSNASFSGQYAFSMSGGEVCADVSSYFTRAGSFFADGKGNITSGLEDINVCTGAATLHFTGGNYSIAADGRGFLKLTNSTGTTNYSIALSSTAAGSIAQTDPAATASGSFQHQNGAAFSNAAIAGGFVFHLSGVDVSGTSINPGSYIGRFDADGAGAIFNGLFDSNIGGTLSGQQLFPTGASYRLATSGEGTTFGRGTANIAGRSFVFYIVDATRVTLIGTDFPSAFIGEAFAQQNTAFTTASLTGSFSFLIGGWSSSGPISTAGRFTADGAGNISNIVLDENNTGSIASLPNGRVSGTFAVDANQFGGGTISWTDTNVGSFSFIFYLISQTHAVFQETDSAIVSDGILMAQTTTPISVAALSGGYTVGWTGASSDEEDLVGQFNLTSSGSLSGTIDINEFGAGKQFFNVPLNDNLTLSGDGTQANKFDADLHAVPVPIMHFTTYVVNQNTSLLVGIDSDRVVAGTLTREP
jgi:hypothetical protein